MNPRLRRAKGASGASANGLREPEQRPRAAPSKQVLHEAALAHLTRSAATAATLSRALDRKVARWAREAARAGGDPDVIADSVAACRASIEAIVARFREVSLIDDVAYAETRAESLSRSGRSRRAIAAHLASKGIDPEIAEQALPSDFDTELAAALVFARKRRIGPYAREGNDDFSAKRKAIAAMARAGFGWSTCERALGMDREQAEERIVERRRR